MIHWNLDTVTIASDEITLLYRRAGQYYHEQKEIRLVINETTLTEKTATWKGGSGKPPVRDTCVLLTFDPKSIFAEMNPSAALYHEFLLRLKEATVYTLTPLEYLQEALEKDEKTNG
jgi:hypothetical protein